MSSSLAASASSVTKNAWLPSEHTPEKLAEFAPLPLSETCSRKLCVALAAVTESEHPIEGYVGLHIMYRGL